MTGENRERRILFSPAWDRRSDEPGRNYGVSGVQIRLCVVIGDWAAELILMTPWMLPAVQAWHKSLEPRIGAMVTPVCEVAVHHRGGVGEFVSNKCHVFPGSPCRNVPVSSFVGDDLYALLVEGGDEPVWAALADILESLREDEEREAGTDV